MTNPNDRWHYEWEQEMREGFISDWNPRIETIDEAPPEFELVPIGAYNGIDLPSTVVLDDNYTVYLETPNPEYNCEVTMN